MDVTSQTNAGIYIIDAGYLRPNYDAIYLIVENDRAVLVDAGISASVPRVLAALQAHGVPPEQVDYIMLTHVHLDHAGGAGLLMTRLPNARLTVHPRGARHMIDPTQLIAGATAVYGAETLRTVYGNIMPVAAARVLETPEGTSIAWQSRHFVFLDTPGHARHHVCIYDDKSRSVFAGDTFGLSFRELDVPDDAFDSHVRPAIFPTTTPVQFEPEALHASIERIVALTPSAVYVTHYGAVRAIRYCADALHRLIDAHVAAARANAGIEQTTAALRNVLLDEIEHGHMPALARDLYANDLALNAQGLQVWREKQQRRQGND